MVIKKSGLSAFLEVQDGGIGDMDGTINGIIVHQGVIVIRSDSSDDQRVDLKPDIEMIT